MSNEIDPSQFYTGLISELYDPLVSEKATADQYTAFIDQSGQPVLEPFCGSGSPLIELFEKGYDIDGLDASEDMLKRLMATAQEKGLDPTVYHERIQTMALPRRYRTIIIAGASMILLSSDEEAQEALDCMYRQLEPGGHILIPIEIQSQEDMESNLGKSSRQTLDDGTKISCTSINVEFDEDKRNATQRLLYERISPLGDTEELEREWQLHWWSQSMFSDMMTAAGFESIHCVDENAAPAEEDAPFFIFIAQKP